MQFFLRNCTHILTRTQGKKFEDMFLVKIANQGTSLNNLCNDNNIPNHLHFVTFTNVNHVLRQAKTMGFSQNTNRWMPL